MQLLTLLGAISGAIDAGRTIREMKFTQKYPRCRTDPQDTLRWSRSGRCPCRSSSAWRQFRLQAEWEDLATGTVIQEKVRY